MLNYAIHRLTYDELKDVYPDLDIGNTFIPTYTYLGFWDELYVGYMAGVIWNIDTIDIQLTTLVPEFRGPKAIRIIHEILKRIHKDFGCILTRINNDSNDMLKILLSAGFHVIGTRGNCVELEKIDG